VSPLTLQQVRQATGGRPLSQLPSDSALVRSVTQDTRNIEPSALFVALNGETQNGHDYLPVAAGKGAVAALVSKAPETSLPNLHLIHVPDTRLAMGKLATYVRQRMTAKVIAVGGSNGKTSTKHLIDACLRNRLRGSISPKSFNNDIGVPLAIFPAEPNQDYLVLEMGTNHHGELKPLSDMAQPDIAVITNIGAEHLEGLDDMMGVRQEEASIISGLNPRGLLVVNGDDRELLSAVQSYPGKQVTFGFEHHNDLFANDIRCDEQGTTFCLNSSKREVFIPMIGKHNACNALAAIAVARRLGVSEEDAIAGLAQSSKPEWRLQLMKAEDVTLLNDAYNANPSSMKVALETLQSLPAIGRRVAIIGDMKELGKATERYHQEIGQIAGKAGFDLLICVGPESQIVASEARRVGMDAQCVLHFDDASDASQHVLHHLRAGDLILLKASRSVFLERLAQTIVEGRSKFFRKAV